MHAALERYDKTRRSLVRAGTVLLTEGDRSGRIYVLAEGVIEVTRGTTQVAVVSAPGAIFGEMSVLLDTPHTATVRTLSPATLFTFEDGEKLLRSDPEMALVIARLLAQRLSAATTYLVDLKRQLEGNGAHLGMVGDVLASLLNLQESTLARTPASMDDGRR